MIGYVQEVITHFSCGECSKWFSVSEYKPEKDKAVTCSHCEHTAIPLEMKLDDKE